MRLVFLAGALAAIALGASGPMPTVSETARPGDFLLARHGLAADVCVAGDDYKVAQIAARDFAADVKRVTGIAPRVRETDASCGPYAVWIGTLGHSRRIDRLAQRGAP